MNNKRKTTHLYAPNSPYNFDCSARYLPREPYELNHLSNETYFQSNLDFNRTFETAQEQIHRTWLEQRLSEDRGICKEQCARPHYIIRGEVLVYGNYTTRHSPEIVVNKFGVKEYTWHRVDPTWQRYWSNQGPFRGTHASLELDNRVLIRSTELDVNGLLRVESISGELFSAYPHELLWPEFFYNYDLHEGVKYLTPGSFHFFEVAEVHPAHATRFTKSKRTRWGKDCPSVKSLSEEYLANEAKAEALVIWKAKQEKIKAEKFIKK